MKTNKLIVFVFGALLLFSTKAFAFHCESSSILTDSADKCVATVIVASNETTLVSTGTVLVYDVSNALNTAVGGATQVRVATASANGVIVAGVAQNSVTSGSQALILTRGKGRLAIKATDGGITSGAALWVSTSGDASSVTNTTQNQLGFSLQNSTQGTGGGTRNVIDAYITVN